MRNLLTMLILASFVMSCSDLKNNQNFEGILESKVTYTSKLDGITAQEIFGKSEETDTTYIKDGFIKSNSNNDLISMRLWRYLDTMSYFFYRSSGDTLWFDRTDSYPYEIMESEIIQNADTILNYVCNALIIHNDRNQALTYYYAPELKLDPEYYVNFSNNSKYEIMKLIKSVYLGWKIESVSGIMEGRTIKLTHQKLDDKLFDIPKHKILKENNY